jgi:gas vesicle protein
MIDNSGKSGWGVFFAFLGGALAGATTALLLAPTSGEEARRKLLDMANEGKEKVTKVPRAIASAYSQAAEVAKDAFAEAYNAAERGHPVGKNAR